MINNETYLNFGKIILKGLPDFHLTYLQHISPASSVQDPGQLTYDAIIGKLQMTQKLLKIHCLDNYQTKRRMTTQPNTANVY